MKRAIRPRRMSDRSALPALFDRMFDESLLPHDVDADAAEAAFEDGVPTLTLPIVEGDARHEIEIHGTE